MFIMFAVLQLVHNLLLSAFSTEFEQVLPLSISSNFPFHYGHLAAVNAFFLVFPSPLSFLLSFLQ